ncbi:MAG: GPR endopeptidase, partial [Oscillospiraceae bacterium]|nr:GPR endopeptidase [Oscillospiraceae bacterium]
MDYRTDLALERLAQTQVREGITEHKRGEHFRITEIRIADDESGKPLGKGKGCYITLEGQSLSRFASDFEGMAA